MVPVIEQPLSRQVRVCEAGELDERLPDWERWFEGRNTGSLSLHPRWLSVLRDGLRHRPYCLEAVVDGAVAGLLPLELVASRLFGRFLVGLPYLNVGGVAVDDPQFISALLDRAVQLADELNVKHLELRHESEWEHPAFTERLINKVHMRLPLPDDAAALWKSFKPALRNQVRKGEKQEFTVCWGSEELLANFYAVFSRNMRDLGTPVFGKRLFRSILRHFPDRAELCVLRAGRKPVAAALLCHGCGVTEVPSASSLREFNSTNANMFMYWQLLQRAVVRGQTLFDFGRSSIDSNTYRFKKQWGAEPHPAIWQYYMRHGDSGDMRLESGKYARRVAVWRRLPVWVTRIIGPPIVRGIP